MPTVEPQRNEDKLKFRYRKASKIILLITLLYTLWVSFLIIGVYYLGIGYKAVVLTLDQWIISSIILFTLFLILELIFLVHHTVIKKKRIESEKPKPIYIKGKRLRIYTLPEGSKGGIFSKTYVKIDENNVLNLRYQMILPYDLWGKKENPGCWRSSH